MERPEPTVRPGTISDAEAIADYHHRCSIKAFTSLVAPGSFDDLDPRRRVPIFLNWLGPESPKTVRVADIDGVAVGHVVTEGNEIVNLFIDPDHWGRGLGRRLLAVGESVIAEAGHREFELQTMVGNDPAIGLYESTGWKVTDTLIHKNQDGIAYDEHVLIKRLDP
jgi:ribosomal protein S18 acetylase RimI-like enzyme